MTTKHTPGRPSIDHGALSPSGTVSKATRAAAIKRASLELFGPGGLKDPSASMPETQAERKERLIRTANEMRTMAARGMQPRRHIKEAKRLEDEAAAIAKAEGRA